MSPSTARAAGLLSASGVILLLALGTSGPAAAAGPPQECPESGPLGQGIVLARDISCTKARRVIRSFMNHALREGRPRLWTMGFYCKNVVPGNGPGIICNRGMKMARYLGSPPAYRLEAQAQTTITCEPCSYPYQQWVDEAKVPTPDVTLTVVEHSCITPSAPACSFPEEGVVDFGSDFHPRQSFYHELGHVFDYYILPEWARVRFEQIDGQSAPWEEPALLHRSPNEQFAESYAFCALKGHTKTPWINGQHVPGGVTVHNRVCRLIDRL
jgi:hypothetical protein